MFTIKYRQFTPAAQQPVEGPTHYDMNEQITGPYDLISQEQTEDGRIVVYAHKGDDPGAVFGPFKGSPQADDDRSHPRPTLWVMNEHGSTVAKYDL